MFDFNGDLISLVVFDGQVSKVNASVNLEPAWRKLLNPGNIACFIIDCGNGYEIITSAQPEALTSLLESRAATSLERAAHQPCRARLGKLIRDMIAELNHSVGKDLRSMNEEPGPAAAVPRMSLHQRIQAA